VPRTPSERKRRVASGAGRPGPEVMGFFNVRPTRMCVRTTRTRARLELENGSIVCFRRRDVRVPAAV